MDERLKDYKLCYVCDGMAYFTRLPLSDQWGDDWDDAPYEHNAGCPYNESEGQILTVMYFCYEFVTPDYGHLNSRYSVQSINMGIIPWLRDFSNGEHIDAGCGIKEFIDIIRRNGGNVYININDFDKFK